MPINRIWYRQLGSLTIFQRIEGTYPDFGRKEVVGTDSTGTVV